MNHAQLSALGRALRVAGEHGQRLEDDNTLAPTDEVRRDLERAMDMLNEALSTAKPTTRCPEHPTGPVDPDAADLCLLCETRRRSGQRSSSRPRVDGTAPDEAAAHVPSQHAIRAERPEPQERWLPEMWNGQAWQLCGTPRRSRPDAETYLVGLLRGPAPAPAYRLVHAFTDHEVARVWGTPDLRPRESAGW
ncbi:hypothetical protein [Streptomyces europaeiscabiei]|uniref:hypothetical protein n=1 Tax=Streptomyces europaeiscabiei TaxID=146819 RepID=UPI0029BB565D|nr:hypothetical protein [Streptomyces europaeiscabiei]MDX3587545.1 hypothetical protein [Streptomyces europaeiscabiei]